MKVSRAEKAGSDFAKSLIEMVNLMYQNNTSVNFYKGLINKLSLEFNDRCKRSSLDKDKLRKRRS